MSAALNPASPPASEPVATSPRYGISMSGYPSERSHGYDVCDEATSPLVVVSWRDTLDEAELEAARLNARREVEPTPRFVVTRHPQGFGPTLYKAIDTRTGRSHSAGIDVRDMFSLIDTLNRGQQPTEAGPDEVPDEAHAALDAMLADAGRCTCVHCELGSSGTFADTDAAIGTPGAGPRPLAVQLEIEADTLELTGVIGPNARRVLAGLVRAAGIDAAI